MAAIDESGGGGGHKKGPGVKKAKKGKQQGVGFHLVECLNK